MAKDNEKKVKAVLEALAQGQSKRTWSDSIKEMMKFLKRKRKLNDRLDYAELMMEILHAMTYSVNGWNQWGNVYRLNRITEEEFKEFIPKLLEVALKWLEIDRDLTSKKEKEMEKNTEAKEQGEAEQSHQIPQPYVS